MMGSSRGLLVLIALGLVAALCIVSFGRGGTVRAANEYQVTCTTGTPTGTTTAVTGTGTAVAGSGTTVACTPQTQAAQPAASMVLRFTVHRSGKTLHFAWRMATSRLLHGFNVYSGKSKLNHKLIAKHKSLSYKFAVKTRKHRPFMLGVVRTRGGQIMVPLG